TNSRTRCKGPGAPRAVPGPRDRATAAPRSRGAPRLGATKETASGVTPYTIEPNSGARPEESARQHARSGSTSRRPQGKPWQFGLALAERAAGGAPARPNLNPSGGGNQTRQENGRCVPRDGTDHFCTDGGAKVKASQRSGQLECS